MHKLSREVASISACIQGNSSLNTWISLDVLETLFCDKKVSNSFFLNSN